MSRSPQLPERGKRAFLGDGIIAYRRMDNSVVYGIRWWERGKMHQKLTGASKAEAKQKLKRKLADIVDQKLGIKQAPVERDTVTVSELADIYVEAMLRKGDKRSLTRDRQCIAKVLKPLAGGRRISEVDESDVRKIQRVRAKEVTNATINRDVALLRSMLTWATTNYDDEGRKYLDENQLGYRKVEMLPEPKYVPYILEADEAVALIEVADNTLTPMIQLALLTGMRSGELIRLDWGDVSWSRETLTIRKTKSGQPKFLKFADSPAVKAVLRSLQPPPSEGDMRNRPVLTNRRGARIKHYQDGWKLALKKAGLPDMRFHDLRHVFGTVACGSVAPAAVSKAMGHSTVRMTEGYVDLAAEITREPLAAASQWLTNLDISATSPDRSDEPETDGAVSR